MPLNLLVLSEDLQSWKYVRFYKWAKKREDCEGETLHLQVFFGEKPKSNFFYAIIFLEKQFLKTYKLCQCKILQKEMLIAKKKHVHFVWFIIC